MSCELQGRSRWKIAVIFFLGVLIFFMLMGEWGAWSVDYWLCRCSFSSYLTADLNREWELIRHIF